MKKACIQSIEAKLRALKREIAFYETGLEQLRLLEEKKFYELTKSSGTVMLVQVWNFGRDHVRFRAFTSSALGTQEEFSLHWSHAWSIKPVDSQDAPLYMTCVWKSSHFEKLLKGRYNKCLPRSDSSPESPPIQNVQTVA